MSLSEHLRRHAPQDDGHRAGRSARLEGPGLLAGAAGQARQALDVVVAGQPPGDHGLQCQGEFGGGRSVPAGDAGDTATGAVVLS